MLGVSRGGDDGPEKQECRPRRHEMSTIQNAGPPDGLECQDREVAALTERVKGKC